MTEAAGRAIGALLGPGDVVILDGPVGAGKTTLARGIGAGMDVTGRITSPTFIIARRHESARAGGGVALVHVDAYRLGDIDAVDDLDLDTEVDQAAVVIEWGRGLVEQLAGSRLLVSFRLVETTGTEPAHPARELHLSRQGPGWSNERWASLGAALRDVASDR